MGFFDKAKSLIGGNLNKFSGNTTVLNAICAGSALVAAASGGISDTEAKAAIRAVGANKGISSAFKSNQIEMAMNDAMTRAEGGRMGKIGLYSDIEKVTDPEAATAVMAAVLDVADEDGEIDPSELEVIKKIGGLLKVDYNKFITI